MSSLTLPQLYSSLHSFVGQTLPDRCDSRVANLLWIMCGIFLSRSARLAPNYGAGDCEFGYCPLIAYLGQTEWDYALRQVGSQLVWWQGNGRWQRVDSLLACPGCRWLGWVVLTRFNQQLTHLVAYWRKGASQAWWLATNLSSARAALHLYRRPMWIEEMFADFKKHGFDLQSSHLRSFLRLGRLTLIACLLYLWLMVVARQVELTGLTDLVDRHDRRDLSLFRLGWGFH